MKTIGEILQLSTNYLDERGFENARRQAEEVISAALNIPRLQLYLDFERPLVSDEVQRCRDFLGRRAKREPVQYIRGQMTFLDCELEVNRTALIPRQETEILVDRIAKQLAVHDLTGRVLWDLCSGSGCIGIALKKKFPALSVVLSDISSEALALARSNAEKNQVTVEFRQGDLLASFIGERAHYIVCNPPYVAEHEFPNLDLEVRDYEPKMALVSGKSGLEFYERLRDDKLENYLERPGFIWFEIGSGQGSNVHKLFSSNIWKSQLSHDWAGHERFFSLEIE